MKKWSKREDNLLRECYPRVGWAGVRNRFPGRSLGSVHKRLLALGIARRAGDAKCPNLFTKPEPLRIHEIKTRACLRCRAAFESTWAGERICRDCKNGPVWRDRQETENSKEKKNGKGRWLEL